MSTMVKEMSRGGTVPGLALIETVQPAYRLREGDLAEFGARLGLLTERQCDVLRRVVRGDPNKVIALDLGISQRTVEKHREGIMRKLRVRSLAALVSMIVLYQTYSLRTQ
ncbi:MAG: LuxR C-terminal-related transcriptional regulator [Methylotetracoccus sp.]